MLITKEDAAELLCISKRQLQRLIDSGEFPIVSLGVSGKGDRIDPADIDRYIGQKKRVKGDTCQSIGAKVVTIGGYMSKSVGKASDDLRKRKTNAKRKS